MPGHRFRQQRHVKEDEQFIAFEGVIDDLVLVEDIELAECPQEELEREADVEVFLLQLDVLGSG
ncbi:MAG: hypothetical protein QM844_13895, partial [Planctomycetota bacterium]|nr:hypothetical protein [Planctomycetota bacterium]